MPTPTPPSLASAQRQKPARLVLVGGFLGAGKTTALRALARSLTAAGQSVGFVTNDQTTNLVDSRTLGRLALPLAEVAGGCFCCRFDDLISSIGTVLKRGPDVLLCEPVGSCTDMAATVLAPLRQYYSRDFTLAPFTVLVEPERLIELPSLPASVRYIVEKQLEEADAILLNKVDTLSPQATAQLCEKLAKQWDKPVLPLSAQSGQGIADWQELLLLMTTPIAPLHEIDYDLYAEGEAVLGWLNATATVHGNAPVSGVALVRDFMERLQRACQQEGAGIAHLKVSLMGQGSWVRMNLTSTKGTLNEESEGEPLVTEATLTINARIALAPERLQELVETSLQSVLQESGAEATLESLESFRPGYPTPPYRIPALSAG